MLLAKSVIAAVWRNIRGAIVPTRGMSELKMSHLTVVATCCGRQRSIVRFSMRLGQHCMHLAIHKENFWCSLIGLFYGACADPRLHCANNAADCPTTSTTAGGQCLRHLCSAVPKGFKIRRHICVCTCRVYLYKQDLPKLVCCRRYLPRADFLRPQQLPLRACLTPPRELTIQRSGAKLPTALLM